MPTPLDKVTRSRNLFLGFAGIVTAASLWSIWSGDTFPAESDPKGDPSTWTESELRRWLKARQIEVGSSDKMTREELVERVKANLRLDKTAKK
ncbi:hypothetical protein DV736_g1177, partial [Chaetothyriales sp. CBS 134916]